MTDKKITEYDVVDFTKSSTKVLGVKSGRTKQVTLGDAAEHDAADFAAANHTHSDMVKTVTVNGTTYSPTNGNVSFDVQGGSVTVDDALSGTSENPVQNKVIKGVLDTKVDAVSGKGLSSNDYTTAEKNKLSGIDLTNYVQTNDARLLPNVEMNLEYTLEMSGWEISSVSYSFPDDTIPTYSNARITVNETVHLYLNGTKLSDVTLPQYGMFSNVTSIFNQSTSNPIVYICVPILFGQTTMLSEMNILNGKLTIYDPLYWINQLAPVAKSGSYNDLLNKPEIPDAPVALSNDYDDLDNKPTIPTKMSQLENDKRYIQNMEAVEMNGYKQLFYIESDGTQGITTAIIPNQNTGFEIEYMSNTAPTATNAPQIINAGGRGTQNRFAVSMYKTGSLSGEVMVKTTSTTAKIDANARQILKYVNDGTNKTITYTDGSTANVESSGDWTAKDTGGNDAPLVIFGLKTTTGYDRCFSGRLYRLKIYNLETLAYDFVPAMRKSDNVVGLYEAVNDVFYTDDRVGATPFGHGDDEILDRVSQLIMDRNIVSDNNFTNAYKNKVNKADNILTSVPASDGTYVLKATVSDGSVTYNWVAE